MIIDGKAMAAEVEADTRSRVERLGFGPGLATILVGDNPASRMYVRIKHAACDRVGIRSVDVNLPEDADEAVILEMIESLNSREDVNGILLQLPLPGGLDPSRAMSAIAPEKDVDGFHPQNMGSLLAGAERLVPCTPKGIICALERLGVDLVGTEVVIVGHSNVVGKPLAAMMLNRNATVQVCHVYTRDLAEHTRRAEVLVVAAGVAGLIKKDMVREGAYVFDVGINKIGDRVVGDVEFEPVREVAAGVTPVPGGVGPLTVSMLLSQTVDAAEMQMETWMEKKEKEKR
ncbi:MAG: tetrahydrofolate dehydrogenase/cyclohydrolase catalytic domain-containing protein [Methanotrichaceae archaeon]